MVVVISIGMVLVEFPVLLGVIWIDDFKNKVPWGFCLFQGVAIQYGAFLQMSGGLCFAYQTYRLLVLNRQGITETLKKVYIALVILYPLIPTAILIYIAMKYDAIKPLTLNWLFGYSGSNFILSFVGVYYSGRAAVAVFRHLDRFKTSISSSRSHIQSAQTSESGQEELTISIDLEENTHSVVTSNTVQTSDLTKQIKVYNLTKAAAIRMVLFSCSFAFINFFASIQTVLIVIKGGKTIEKGLSGHDWVGALQGSIIFLIFGIPQNVRKFFLREARF
ncbi:6579_t:CDS:2 [Funneliformis caledonium]|uniref:6579_t:CDS:1 n=1 Tax=Funneliformis caledonium TaxID=1117310 RepID=A0A9N8Z4Y4_9GLOM|nr:6579_t:CDS:2 [Funneliformis caledonium]